jgi:hypothetical protein
MSNFYSARAAGCTDPTEDEVGNKLAADQCNAKVGHEDDPLQSLRRRAMMRIHEHVNLEKAVDILERHPEFAEFLWLLRSGLV